MSLVNAMQIERTEYPHFDSGGGSSVNPNSFSVRINNLTEGLGVFTHENVVAKASALHDRDFNTLADIHALLRALLKEVAGAEISEEEKSLCQKSAALEEIVLSVREAIEARGGVSEIAMSSKTVKGKLEALVKNTNFNAAVKDEMGDLLPQSAMINEYGNVQISVLTAPETVDELMTLVDRVRELNTSIGGRKKIGTFAINYRNDSPEQLAKAERFLANAELAGLTARKMFEGEKYSALALDVSPEGAEPFLNTAFGSSVWECGGSNVLTITSEGMAGVVVPCDRDQLQAPGGKPDKGEKAHEVAQRELKEEMNVDAVVTDEHLASRMAFPYHELPHGILLPGEREPAAVNSVFVTKIPAIPKDVKPQDGEVKVAKFVPLSELAEGSYDGYQVGWGLKKLAQQFVESGSDVDTFLDKVNSPAEVASKVEEARREVEDAIPGATLYNERFMAALENSE